MSKKLKVSEEFAEQVKNSSREQLTSLLLELYKELEEWKRLHKEDVDIQRLKQDLKEASALYVEKTKECKSKLNYIVAVLSDGRSE